MFFFLNNICCRYLEANQAKQFDQFILALQWPMSYCNMHSDGVYVLYTCTIFKKYLKSLAFYYNLIENDILHMHMVFSLH